MRFPSDDELMAGPNAFGDARIEVAPDAADPEADARAQIEAGLGETSDEAGAESGDDADSEDSEDSEGSEGSGGSDAVLPSPESAGAGRSCRELQKRCPSPLFRSGCGAYC